MLNFKRIIPKRSLPIHVIFDRRPSGIFFFMLFQVTFIGDAVPTVDSRGRCLTIQTSVAVKAKHPLRVSAEVLRFNECVSKRASFLKK